MREIEKRIQEKRTVKATQNKLMGFNGKLGCIVRNLGQPLVSHSESGGFHDLGMPLGSSSEFTDVSWEDARSANDFMRLLPTMEMLDALGNPMPDMSGNEWSEPRDRTNTYTATVGWHFDGLSRGIHLEITYKEYDKSLVAIFQGREVYREQAGELMAYIPSPTWEDKIEQLYKVAKLLDDENKRKEREEEIAEAKKEKEKWWKETRNKWGL
jgi:hypothetical protein